MKETNPLDIKWQGRIFTAASSLSTCATGSGSYGESYDKKEDGVSKLELNTPPVKLSKGG